MNRDGGQGGNERTTYAPVPTWLTNRGRAYLFDQVNTGYADFTKDEYSSVLFWHANEVTGTVIAGATPLEITQKVNKSRGTMKPLPEWITKGAIIGIVQSPNYGDTPPTDTSYAGWNNKQDFIRDRYQFLKDNNLPLVGIWMQDWVGSFPYDEGVRLLWDWKLNREFYPQWDEMIDEWNADGVRPFLYINPYIAYKNPYTGEISETWAEADRKLFFVHNQSLLSNIIDSISI